MCAIFELGQVKSRASRNSNVVECDGRALSLVLDGSSSISKSAAVPGRQSRVRKSRSHEAAEKNQKRNHVG